MRIEVSTDKRFVRVTLGARSRVMTMSEWSHAITNPTIYRPDEQPAEPADAGANVVAIKR